MGRWYLNTFHPLVATAYGRRACETHALDPFVDGSIRREPDFKHPRPGISCVCRASKFAPRLELGDTVIYLTVKDWFGGPLARHQRLVAVLRVDEVAATHEDAAARYRAGGLPLPSNCMVKSNASMPVEHSNGGRGTDPGRKR